MSGIENRFVDLRRGGNGARVGKLNRLHLVQFSLSGVIRIGLQNEGAKIGKIRGESMTDFLGLTQLY